MPRLRLAPGRSSCGWSGRIGGIWGRWPLFEKVLVQPNELPLHFGRGAGPSGSWT